MRPLKPRFVKFDGTERPQPVTHMQFHNLIRGNEKWFEKTHRTWWGKKIRLLILAKTAMTDFEPHLIEVSPTQSRASNIRIAYRMIAKNDEISHALAKNGDRVVVFR